MNGINVTFGLKMEWEKISVGAGQEGRRRCDGRIEWNFLEDIFVALIKTV